MEYNHDRLPNIKKHQHLTVKKWCLQLSLLHIIQLQIFLKENEIKRHRNCGCSYLAERAWMLWWKCLQAATQRARSGASSLVSSNKVVATISSASSGQGVNLQSTVQYSMSLEFLLNSKYSKPSVYRAPVYLLIYWKDHNIKCICVQLCYSGISLWQKSVSMSVPFYILFPNVIISIECCDSPYQSIVQQLISEGNIRSLVVNAGPRGERETTKCKLVLTRSVK